MDYVQDVMASVRHRDFPILDEQRRFVGMLSRRYLLNTQKKQVILVDHNEKMQAVDGIEQADILEIIDHHRIGSLETMSPIFSAISLWAALPRSSTRCIRRSMLLWSRKSRVFCVPRFSQTP